MIAEKHKIRESVVMVWKDAQGRCKKLVHKNLVTNKGLVYYAQKAAGETASWDYNELSLVTAMNSPTATSTFGDLTTIPSGGTQTVDAGYPTTDDQDSDNQTFADVNVVTWRFSYMTSEANGTIIGGAIRNHTLAASSGTNALLNHFSLTTVVTKSSLATLKVFVNHTFQAA